MLATHSLLLVDFEILVGPTKLGIGPLNKYVMHEFQPIVKSVLASVYQRLGC